MRVHLGGHLSWYDPLKRPWLEIPQPAPISLIDLARLLGVPPEEIAVVTVNKAASDLGADAADGDTVEFFPAVGGG